MINKKLIKLKIKQIKKKNKLKTYNICRFYIKSTFNNTFVTITNLIGKPFVFYSTGKIGFKQSKRSSNYAAESVILQSIKYLKNIHMYSIVLYYSGIRNLLKPSFKHFKKNKIKILSINNYTPITFNGCRASKIRRV
jgi:small subunit ribosomal protein S11